MVQITAGSALEVHQGTRVPPFSHSGGFFFFFFFFAVAALAYKIVDAKLLKRVPMYLAATHTYTMDWRSVTGDWRGMGVLFVYFWVIPWVF